MAQVFTTAVFSISTQLDRALPLIKIRNLPPNRRSSVKDAKHAANHAALEFKERRRLWFRDLLRNAGSAEVEALSLQLVMLIDGAIAAALVRHDPAVARAAREAARVLIAAAGVADGVPRRRVRS